MSTRTLNDLLETDTPAWPRVRQELAQAVCPVEILPPSDPQRSEALVGTQVSVRHTMGAIVYETGGLLIDHGWLRILGSGHPRLPRSILDWNRVRSFERRGQRGGYLLVADDIVGGFFAIDGGALGAGKADVFYYAPDSLQWISMDRGYRDFLAFCLSGALNNFYASLRWPGWEAEAAGVPGDQALLFTPPLCTRQSRDISKCSRRPAPIAEIFELNMVKLPRQLGQ